MQYAQDELGAVLAETPISDARFPVYSNVSALPVTAADAIRENLLRQVTSPVLWETSMRNMRADGVEQFIEAGPGNVLQGLLKRIDTDASCRAVGTREELESNG
jgi:[acyl-carrier-protein] S-malonyltransferase